jgi:hypothetical protein
MKNETEHVQNIDDLSVENKFDAAVAGYPPEQVEFLRRVAQTAAFISTWDHLTKTCDALDGLSARQELRKALSQIGPSDREQVERCGVSGEYFLQMSLHLLLPTVRCRA